MATIYLTTQQLSELIHRSRRTIEKDRLRGFGPPFVRMGPRMVRYRLEDVEAWVASQLRNSTSDPGSTIPPALPANPATWGGAK